MPSLMDATEAMFKSQSFEERWSAEQRFIEVLTFSSSTEILAMLDEVVGRDLLELPVWARNLAFRLACLQEPNNADIIRRAGGDLLLFGPDWDDIAKELLAKADSLDAG